MKQQRKLWGQVTNFDIRLLRVFRAVVECGGFSAAEVELNISRSAISISMADLEERVGLRLCQRGRAGFSLTDEGELVYQASQQLMTSLENFRTQVNAIHAELKGELIIGITNNLVTMKHMKVTNALHTLKKLGPEIEVQIRMNPPNEIERSVLDGGLHVGVVPDLRKLPGLEYFQLYDEESHLYCNSDHPLFGMNDEEITDKMIHKADAVSPAYAQLAETKVHYQDLNTTAIGNDREGVAFLIHTGSYIGYLPTHYAKQWLASGEIRALRPDKFNYSTNYHAVTRKGARPNLILETFLKELLKAPDEKLSTHE
ncbi:MAG: LysR family transcriptional regulator [Psychrosphaera sp.]|nr:LysR family transcriptional regulator [Psychrosphaera sp.]